MSVTAPATDTSARVIPGRECGSCSMCCKVYNIPELNKPAGKWCSHCKPGKGCVIHDSVPTQCAEFNCLWRIEEKLPPHWKPDQAKMVVTIHPFSGYVYVQVDTSAPSAWRRQPYYDQLRGWATRNLQLGMYVIVFVSETATLILPDKEVPLGQFRPADRLAVRRSGAGYEAMVIPAGGPGPPAVRLG